jgi:hypothetical protein
MALERPPGAIGFMFRIKMQHHSCDFTPVSTLRIRVARAAAPLVHGKPGIASPGVGKAGAIDGFNIDIEEAKALRDIKHRLAVFLRKRYGPSENGGPLTDAEIVEETELDAIYHLAFRQRQCQPGATPLGRTNPTMRSHQKIDRR